MYKRQNQLPNRAAYGRRFKNIFHDISPCLLYTSFSINKIPSMAFVFVAFSLNEAAYMAEAIRAAILSVDKKDIEAAHSIGMTGGQTMRRVILPQAMIVAIPNLGNSLISLVKSTSLAFTIGVMAVSYTHLIITLGIIILVTMFGKDAEHRKVSKAFEVFPFIVFVAVVFDVVYLIIARFIGPELVSLIAAVVTLFVVLATSKSGFLMPKDEWTFDAQENWDKSWLSVSEVSEPAQSDLRCV